MFDIADNLIKLISAIMADWKTCIYADNTFLGRVNISHGIFQGDSFLPLLFVLALTPISRALIDIKMGYSLAKGGPVINRILFMDDIKLFGKTENEINSLIQTVRICSQDIKMEFRVNKCAVLTMKRGGEIESSGVLLPSGDKLGDPIGGGYKYLGNFGK